MMLPALTALILGTFCGAAMRVWTFVIVSLVAVLGTVVTSWLYGSLTQGGITDHIWVWICLQLGYSLGLFMLFILAHQVCRTKTTGKQQMPQQPPGGSQA